MRTLAIYRTLAAWRWPTSYAGKFLLVAFLGVHVPLLTLVTFVTIREASWKAAVPILVVTLFATLAGSAVTLFVQNRLLAPVLETGDALQAYATRRALPDLPTGFTDEAGMLMRNAQETVTRLDELLRLKNDLLAVLAHDLRAPLATISTAGAMATELLDAPGATGQASASLAPLLKAIRSAADRQLALIGTLLALARSDAGVMELQPTRTTVAELLERVRESAAMAAERKRVTLHVEGTAAAELGLCVDVPKTQQVLDNLVNNAIKFTSPGGRVELTVTHDDDWVLLTVSDTGVGMDEDVREKLFTPFTTAHRPGTSGETGTGLGLWIARSFTELQGGTIAVESEPMRGTSFVVKLPRRVERVARESVG